MDSKKYIVTTPRKAKYAEAMPIRPKYDDVNIEHCPECGASLQLSKWIGEKTIRINKKDIPDFMYIYGGADNQFIISEKAYRVLMDNQVTGLIGAEKINKILYKKEIVEFQTRMEQVTMYCLVLSTSGKHLKIFMSTAWSDGIVQSL